MADRAIILLQIPLLQLYFSSTHLCQPLDLVFFNSVKQKMKNDVPNVSSQMDQVMLQMMVNNMDVAEFYSPPRITDMAVKMGLRAGWSMDITTNDTDGRAWDFNVAEMRNRAARRVLKDKPLLLIGSQMCTV